MEDLAKAMNEMSMLFGRERGINVDAVRDDVLGLERGASAAQRREARVRGADVGALRRALNGGEVIEVSEVWYSEPRARQVYAENVARMLGVGNVFNGIPVYIDERVLDGYVVIVPEPPSEDFTMEWPVPMRKSWEFDGLEYRRFWLNHKPEPDPRPRYPAPHWMHDYD